jgi:hypothetical protein
MRLAVDCVRDSRTRLLAMVVTGLVMAALPLAAAAAASSSAVGGQGSGVYLYPPFTGDRVDVTVEASGVGGRFDVTHFDKFGKVFAHLSGTVDCVSIQGQSVFTTGTITAGHAPEVVGDVAGKAFAITFVDNGERDLAGVSYPMEDIPACSFWPLNMVIDRGDYTASR